MKTITREEVLWYFHYDRPNGKLYWKNHWDKTLKVGWCIDDVGS